MTRDEARAALLAEARRYVKRGVQEVRVDGRGTNRGLEVDFFLHEVDSPLGEPWCAAAVHQCGVQAVGRSRWPFKATASVPALVAAAAHVEKDPAQWAPGDLLVLYFPSLSRYAHVGVIDAVVLPGAGGAGSVTSLDGNSNSDGSRDGYAYVRKTRPLSPHMAALVWPEGTY